MGYYVYKFTFFWLFAFEDHQLLPYCDKATINMKAGKSLWVVIFFSIGYILEVKWLDQMDSSSIKYFGGTSVLFSSCYCNLNSHSQYTMDPFSLHTLQHLLSLICCLCDSNLHKSEVKVHSGFALSLPGESSCWTYLTYLLAIRMSSLGKFPSEVFTHFQVRLFSFVILGYTTSLL